VKAIVKTKNLCKTYLKGTVPVKALRGISMEIAHGEFVSIVGRSGSGKSTLLNLIGGLDTPSSGSLFVGGRDLGGMTRNELAGHRRHQVGMIFQSFNLIPSRTAQENVTLALAFGGVSRGRRKNEAAKLIGKVGLTARLDHRPGELSGGEAQRIAIARAIANNPVILLADEPTGNLDTKTSADIISLLQQLNREGMTILMVTHDEKTAQRVSHRVIYLLDGQVSELKRLKESP